MYNKTVLDWLSETKDEVVTVSCNRWMEIGASLVFLLLMCGNRSHWLAFFNIGVFVEGIQFTLFPSSMSYWVSGEIDSTHLTLIRSLGILCLLWAAGCFLLCKSTDSTAETSMLLALSVLLLSSLIAKGYLLSHSGKRTSAARMDDEQLTKAFYITLLAAVGTLFHTLKSNDWGGFGEQPSHANLHLRIDFVLLLVMAVTAYSMPQWCLRMVFGIEKVDTLHTYLARSNGEVMLGMAIMSVRSANFLRTNDKDVVVFSHLMCYVLFAVMKWTCMVGSWSEQAWKHVAMQGLHDTVIILNAIGALNRDFSVVTRVIIPRIKAIPTDLCNMCKQKRY